jgi:hypothetical protein
MSLVTHKETNQPHEQDLSHLPPSSTQFEQTLVLQSTQTAEAQCTQNSSSSKTGWGIVHKGYIYGVSQDTPLAAQLLQLTEKEERRNFILLYGEKHGKVDMDTRCQTPQKQARKL